MGTCNTTIIGTNELILIDPGESLDKCFNDLCNRLQSDSLDMRKVNLMLFTHVHFDHSNAAAMVQKVSHCRIRTHPYDVSSIEFPQIEYERMITPITQSGEFPNIPLKWTKYFMDLFIGKRLPVKNDIVLKDREIMTHEGLTIEVIFTPGHAPGHVAYYIPKYKTLIGGDIIDREMYGIIESGGCINNMESSWDQLLQTLEIIAKLDIELYIPGHGAPIVGKEAVREFIDKNIEFTLKKPKQILTLLHPTAISLGKIFSQLYPRLPFAHHQVKKIEILLLLKYLLKKEKVVCIRTEKGTIWKSNIIAEQAI